MVCGKEEGEGGEGDALLECEKCENPWHLGCLRPKLTEIPDGEWHCPNCTFPVGKSENGNSGSKRANDDGEEDQQDGGATTAKKRRA